MKARFPGEHEDEPVGHIPLDGCKACGGVWPEGGIPYEPCPNQRMARALVRHGYASWPSSPEAFERVVALARRP